MNEFPAASADFYTLFEQARHGDLTARNALYKVAFARLRSIASALLRRERRGHTLQPTALVGELFLKLSRFEIRILNEDHFFRISARAMRQVLIDHARTRGAAKKLAPASFAELLIDAQRDDTDLESLIEVRRVFEKLQALDSLAARTVWLRIVEGATVNEVSRMQNREVWRVRADFDFGLKWMADRFQARPRSSKSASAFAHT